MKKAQNGNIYGTVVVKYLKEYLLMKTVSNYKHINSQQEKPFFTVFGYMYILVIHLTPEIIFIDH